MILVIGSVTCQGARFQDALTISQEHVHRSRAEPGCLAHAVHVDSENPDRLVFVEQWADSEALARHFREPASRAFAKALGALATEQPSLSVYQATPVPV